MREVYKNYAESDGVIHYREARVITYAELIGGGMSMISENNENFRLSKYPRIIYDSNNVPIFYEFELTHSNSHTASITVSARKNVLALIYYIESKSQEIYKEFDNGYNQYYADGYPNRRIFKSKKDGNFYTLTEKGLSLYDDELVIKSPYEQRESMLKQMSKEELDTIYKYGIVLDEIQKENIIQTKKYWDMIFEILNGIFGNSNFFDDNDNDDYTYNIDIEIAKKIEANMAGNYQSVHEIPEFINPRLRVTHWSGYCGPAALSFIYRGYFDRYPIDSDYYINIYGDGNYKAFRERTLYGFWDFSITTSDCETFDMAKEKYIRYSFENDNGLNACFYRHCSWLGRDKKGNWYMPLYDLGLSKGIKTATSGKLKSNFTVYPIAEIRKNNPIIIAVNCNHYLVGIGCSKTKRAKYELVVDNGYTTQSRNFAPYWHAFDCWNLHYTVSH